jgi:nitrate reductase NapE component
MINFMKGSSAIAIGLLITAAFTFPILAVGIVIGWIFIEQEVDMEKE